MQARRLANAVARGEVQAVPLSDQPDTAAANSSTIAALSVLIREVVAVADEADSAVSTGAETGAETRAGNVSISALIRRGMSRWELEQTLLRRELDPEVVQAELDRLAGVGLIDDAALAETYVRTQHERKGLGRSVLAAELKRKHIDQLHIDAALAQLNDEEEQSRATQIATKRASQLSSYDLTTAKRRLIAFMMRKGYGSGVIRIAVDEALTGRPSGSTHSTTTVQFR